MLFSYICGYDSAGYIHLTYFDLLDQTRISPLLPLSPENWMNPHPVSFHSALFEDEFSAKAQRSAVSGNVASESVAGSMAGRC